MVQLDNIIPLPCQDYLEAELSALGCFLHVGLFPRDARDVSHHNPHLDVYDPHLVGLYDVNDSDGNMVAFDQTADRVGPQQAVETASSGQFTAMARIAPRKGRMASFNGKHYHADMPPMKASHWIVVTFNFS